MKTMGRQYCGFWQFIKWLCLADGGKAELAIIADTFVDNCQFIFAFFHIKIFNNNCFRNHEISLT